MPFERRDIVPLALVASAAFIDLPTPPTRRTPQSRPIGAVTEVCHGKGRGAPTWNPPASLPMWRVVASFIDALGQHLSSTQVPADGE